MVVEVVRRLAIGCVLAVALGLAWTAVVLLSVRDDLQAAQAALQRAPEAAGTALVQRELVQAERLLAGATGRLDDPVPALVARLPVLGRTPTAVRRTSEAALAAVRSSRRVLAVVADGPPLLVEGRLDAGRVDAVATELRRAAGDVAGPVARLAGVETALVPGVVREGVTAAREVLAGSPQALADAADAVTALGSLTGGDRPRRVLVVLQNNAELRGTGGLVSVFAELTLDQGRLTVGGFRDVESVADPAPAVRRVEAPPDYRALFGPLLADSTLWKNTNADPDVPTSSAVLARVAAQTLTAAPDAVLWLDTPALAAVLEGTSPVRLPDGTELTAGNLVDRLLSVSYRGAGSDEDSRDRRRAELRAAADAVVSRLLTGSPDLARLSGSLRRAAQARHLAIWSADAQEQRGFAAGGLAGEVAAGGGDLASVTVHNLGGGGSDGNKLDYYARREEQIRVRIGQRAAEVERTVTLRNTAPAEGLPGYVAGTVQPGTTSNLVLHSLPPGAEVLELRRGDQQLDRTPSPLGDSIVLRDVVTLAPGTSTTWVVRYRLPLDDPAYRLRLIPQPLAVPGTLDVRIDAADGVVLVPRPGSGLERREVDGAPVWALSGQTGPQRELVLDVGRPAWPRRAVDAVRRFWSEPVPVPW